CFRSDRLRGLAQFGRSKVVRNAVSEGARPTGWSGTRTRHDSVQRGRAGRAGRSGAESSWSDREPGRASLSRSGEGGELLEEGEDVLEHLVGRGQGAAMIPARQWYER